MEYVNLDSIGLKVYRFCVELMTDGSKKWRAWVLNEKAFRPFLGRAIGAHPVHGF